MITQIAEIKDDLKAGKEPIATVRALLSWFGAYRRRAGIVERIRTELQEAGIATAPDFTETWIDAEIRFKTLEPTAPPVATTPTSDGTTVVAQPNQPIALREATQRVGMLDAANKGVTSVFPQDTIDRAITLMLSRDYSQLPVMTNERELRGVISWKSIGSKLTQRNPINSVVEATEPTEEIFDHTSLFEATKRIIKSDYVFVRSSRDKKISGIVTATDLSEQFRRLSEPFLLIGQIENRLRNMIHDAFDTETLRAACNENDPVRRNNVHSPADLTLGELVRLLEIEANWQKVKFVADRKTFCKLLGEARDIRNDVMHFDPDGIEDTQFEQLRQFSNLLEELERLSAPKVG